MNCLDAELPTDFSGMEMDGSRAVTVFSGLVQEKTAIRMTAESGEIILDRLFSSNVSYFYDCYSHTTAILLNLT